jgi:hypothetical protein
VCNPPYLREDERGELAPDVREHEPPMALFAGPDGFAVLRRLADGLGRWLTDDGVALVEVGAEQGAGARRAFAARPWAVGTALHRDLAGIERVVEASRAPVVGGSRAPATSPTTARILRQAGDGEPLSAPVPGLDAPIPVAVAGTAEAVTLEEARWTMPDGETLEVLVAEGPEASAGLLDSALLDEAHRRLGSPTLAAAIPGQDRLWLTDALQPPERGAAFEARARDAHREDPAPLTPLLFAVRGGACAGPLQLG